VLRHPRRQPRERAPSLARATGTIYHSAIRPPPPLLHPLDLLLSPISPRGEKREKAVQAREGGTKGIQNTVSEDGANRCGCCAVVIRAIPVPSWIRGWFAPIAETPLATPNAFLVRAVDFLLFWENELLQDLRAGRRV